MKSCFLSPGLRPRTTGAFARYATALSKFGRRSFSTSDPRVQRTESHQYNCSVEAEPLHRYRPGGYHPVHLGDSFKNGRYTVIHKLGSGSYSTVWLARDKTQQRYVALKIAVSAPSSNSRELQTLQLVGQRATTSCHSRYIQRLLDAFEHEGPNGTHRCLVLELLGPSVPSLIHSHYPEGRLPGDVAKSVALQVASGLAFLHENGVGHGDLHTANIAFVPPSIDALSEAELMAKLGSPDTGAVNHVEGRPLPPQVPEYLVWPTTLPMPEPTAQDSVRIIDFGESFQADNCPRTLHTPLATRAPEVVFGDRFDYRVDLWSLGCTMFELITGQPPFDSLMGDKDLLVTQMIESIGELPKKWQCRHQTSAYKSKDTQTTSSDSAADTPLAATHCSGGEATGDVGYSLQQWLEEVYFDESKTADLTRRDLAEFGDVLRLLLRFEVDARLGATDLIHGSWLG